MPRSSRSKLETQNSKLETRPVPCLIPRMTKTELGRMERTAIEAAQAAGKMMRDNLRKPKKVNLATQHDIKLELDVRCQKRIEKTLRLAFPKIPILGEEGILGTPEAPTRWVVDPIDGTVNFTYGLPHACVSIALQQKTPGKNVGDGGFESVVGVVYDPFTDEMWTATKGGPARLNGTPIHVSERARLNEAIVAIGFAKERATLGRMLPILNDLIPRIRKVRIMGAAALSLVYVATGRMDAYVEFGLRLWDIAAGGLIVECAGGEFWREPVKGDYRYQILASNGRVHRAVRARMLAR